MKDIETSHIFRINISSWALTNWGFNDLIFNNKSTATATTIATEIAFPFAIEFSDEKFNDGTVKEAEEFVLSLPTGYDKYPYDLEKIKFQEIAGYEIKFENETTFILQYKLSSRKL